MNEDDIPDANEEIEFSMSCEEQVELECESEREPRQVAQETGQVDYFTCRHLRCTHVCVGSNEASKRRALNNHEENRRVHITHWKRDGEDCAMCKKFIDSGKWAPSLPKRTHMIRPALPPKRKRSVSSVDKYKF